MVSGAYVHPWRRIATGLIGHLDDGHRKLIRSGFDPCSMSRAGDCCCAYVILLGLHQRTPLIEGDQGFSHRTIVGGYSEKPRAHYSV